MKYHFKIHKEKNGFWAECLELEGCSTQADTKEELQNNMVESLNLFLSEPETSKHIFPKPKKVKLNVSVVEIPVDPMVAAAIKIRELRLKNKLTQKGMMEKLGLKFLSNYQRLENPKKSNPELKTLARIKKKFPEFRVEEILA
ncbi:MAG: type II toxin-antitoxin system HicB family antitoxin [Bdellovibrionota bacterium]